MKERVMSVPSRRLAVAGVIAAAVIALPAAAFASASSTSSGKPGPSAAASQSAPAIKSPPPASESAAPNSSAAAMKAAARGSRALENGTMPSMVAALATQLGVSHSAAQRAMNEINALSDRNGADPASPAFAAIAHQLGVTPDRLDAALGAAKQAAGQSVGRK
jgi:hypothetical protein